MTTSLVPAPPRLPLVQRSVRTGDRTRQELELVSAMPTFGFLQLQRICMRQFFPSFACNLNRSGPARGLSASGLNAFLFKHSAMLVVGIEREASRVVEVEVRRIASTGGIHLVINTAPGAI